MYQPAAVNSKKNYSYIKTNIFKNSFIYLSRKAKNISHCLYFLYLTRYITKEIPLVIYLVIFFSLRMHLHSCKNT